MRNNPIFSVIIPTIGRKTLSRSVLSVLNQTNVSEVLEIIIVNDSGCPLEEKDWLHAPIVTIVNTNQRERSFARNTGAAISRGDYLIFLDDDDWLLPGALKTFNDLIQYNPEATLLYGGVRIVDGFGKIVAEAHSPLNGDCFGQILGGSWVPLQTSCFLSSAFFKVGGFNPQFLVTQDQDLIRRISVIGPIASTPSVVACLTRGAGWQSSTNYTSATEFTRTSRDDVLSLSGAFSRSLATSKTAYWRGRIFHIYASLILWHFRKKRLTAGFSRACSVIGIILVSSKYLVSNSFWEAAKASHVPGELHHIERAMKR